MKGLDLSKFQKKDHKEGHTILLHPDGHEIRIAHSALSPKMLKELSALPMADGGGVVSQDAWKTFQKGYNSSTGYQPKPEEAKQGQPQQQQPQPTQTAQPTQPAEPEAGGGMIAKGYAEGDSVQPQEDPDTVPEAMSGEQWQPSTQPMQQPQQAISQPQPESNPTDQPAQVPQQAPSLDEAKSGVFNFLNQEDANTAHDLAMGHVKPESYKDLFGKKDTLGKIGTIFGLLVGGAGSGLIHQPNAMMEMMDKEIKRDMDAQNQSSANATNFLRIAQQDPQVRALANKYGVDAAQIHQQMMYQNLANTSANELMGIVKKHPPDPQMQQALLLTLQHFGDKIQNAKTLTTLNSLGLGSGGGEPNQANSAPPPNLSGPSGFKQSKKELHDQFKPLLSPDATTKFSAANPKINPLSEPDYGKLGEQYDQVDKVDRLRSRLGGLYQELANNTGGYQALGNAARALPYSGEKLGDAVSNMSPSGRRYVAALQALKTEGATALQGTDIGVEGLNQFVEGLSPKVLDNPQAVMDKLIKFDNTLKNAPKRTLLRKYKMLNE